MHRLAAWTALLLALAAPVRAADDPLARARQLYNQGQFEQAINAAEQARLTPARADAVKSYLGGKGVGELRERVSELVGGETVTMTFTFAEAGSITVQVPVEPKSYTYSTYSPPPIPTPTASAKPHR